MCCVVLLLVLIYFIGSASCCSTSRQCGIFIPRGNKTIFYPTGMCCSSVHPRRCMDFQACYRSLFKPTPWRAPWIPITHYTIKIPRWTYSKFTYQPTDTSYDDGYRIRSSSDNSSTYATIVAVVIFISICLFMSVCVSVRHSRRRFRQTPQRFTGQSEETRNSPQVVMVISAEERDNTVPQTLADEPPSYEDVVRLSPPNYDGVPPPPRYEHNDVPPPPRYEQNDVPPPPRYEDNDVPPPSRYEHNDVPPPPPRYEDNDVPPPRYEHNDLPPPPRYEDVVNEGNAATSNSAPRVSLS